MKIHENDQELSLRELFDNKFAYGATDKLQVYALELISTMAHLKILEAENKQLKEKLEFGKGCIGSLRFELDELKTSINRPIVRLHI